MCFPELLAGLSAAAPEVAPAVIGSELLPTIASQLPASLASAGPLAGMLEPLLAAGLPAGSAAGMGILGGTTAQRLAAQAGLGLLTQKPQQAMLGGGGGRPQPEPTQSATSILGASGLYPQTKMSPGLNTGNMGVNPLVLQQLLQQMGGS